MLTNSKNFKSWLALGEALAAESEFVTATKSMPDRREVLRVSQLHGVTVDDATAALVALLFWEAPNRPAPEWKRENCSVTVEPAGDGVYRVTVTCNGHGSQTIFTDDPSASASAFYFRFPAFRQSFFQIPL